MQRNSLAILRETGTAVTVRVEGEPTPAPQAPGLLRRAVNFTEAAAKHVAAGRPQASDETVAGRFAICQACHWFKANGEGRGHCQHSRCGCNVAAVGLSGLNKLRWASEACPIGKWKAAPTG